MSHVSGSSNIVADFLSRVALVDENIKPSDFSHKSAQHIVSPFPLGKILTKSDIEEVFTEKCVVPCLGKEYCHLNVNAELFRGLGPFKFNPNCLTSESNVLKINNIMAHLGTQSKLLSDLLSLENI